ncbi:MAG: kelch repeat-containing protein [Chloroflexota bacterium]
MLTGSMHHSRSYETATLLQDGRVLVAGGEENGDKTVASAELYDPATGQWTDTGSMHAARRGHTATVLADGRVLVAGGWNLAAQPQAPLFAELYDPASGTWSKTGSMTRWRYRPLATLLSDGRVLVTGGYIGGQADTKGAELYDPGTGTWSWARPMIAPPATATRLADGKVLVLHGGRSPELYDPGSGRWTETTNPTQSHGFAEATLLANGDVLVLGIAGNGTVDTAELYDPTSGIWSPTNRPLTGRGPATLLSDGTVLLVGRDASGRYDPGTGTWAAVPRPPLPRDYALDSSEGVEVDFVIPLLDGRILAAEGGSVAVFDPSGTP